MTRSERWRRTARRRIAALAPGDTAWRGAALGIYLLGTLFLVAYFSIYNLQDFSAEKLPGYLVRIGLLLAAGPFALLLLRLANRLPTAFLLAFAMMAPFMAVVAIPGDEKSRAVSGLLLVVLAALTGGGVAVLLGHGFDWRSRKAAAAALVAGLVGFLAAAVAIWSGKGDANPALADFRLADRTLDLPNPGLPGAYRVRTLTYGSGSDRHRREFAEQADLVARTVDGSKLIDNWDGLSGALRSSYWGFDATELPLQATVWYPEGEGPFPLILIVHGNHSMEDFSDPGYAYLGEFFASRGFIFASVDENFINSSVSSRVDVFADRPGLQEENDARAWLLLEHLAQWRDWNAAPGNPFHGRVDMDRVALIGHSRGGEAVGIAAAFNALDRYPDDATLDFDFGFNLRGVIAIAPVYGQYEPRERPTPVRDVSYFTIHGDMDGDVQSFEGVAQYSRVSFSGGDFRFRSSLYVVGANHGQFNTTWNNLDTGLFQAWALDLGRIMDGEAQRAVARVYFGAFIEIVLHERRGYLPIFRDARHAARWLPDTYYINQYADSDGIALVNFEEDLDPSTMTVAGGRIDVAHVSRWYETANALKYDELDTHSLVLAWDRRYDAESARVDFRLAAPVSGSVLTASISAADVATLPDDFDPEPGTDTGDDDADTLDWTIEVEFADGNKKTLALSDDSPLYPLVRAVPRRAGFLDGADEREVLFRHFEFDLGEPVAVARISFVFDRSPKGAIMIDDVSLAERRLR